MVLNSCGRAVCGGFTKVVKEMICYSQTKEKEERTLTGLALSVHMGKGWLRGVDLNSMSALIPCKLLILRYAKLAKTAKKADLSYRRR